MMVGDNRKYNVALVTLMSEGATGELPGTDKLAGVALEVGHLQHRMEDDGSRDLKAFEVNDM